MACERAAVAEAPHMLSYTVWTCAPRAPPAGSPQCVLSGEWRGSCSCAVPGAWSGERFITRCLFLPGHAHGIRRGPRSGPRFAPLRGSGALVHMCTNRYPARRTGQIVSFCGIDGTAFIHVRSDRAPTDDGRPALAHCNCCSLCRCASAACGALRSRRAHAPDDTYCRPLARQVRDASNFEPSRCRLVRRIGHARTSRC